MTFETDAPVKVIPAKRAHPSKESDEKKHVKITSYRKQASKKIIEQESDEEIHNALRLTSAEFLEDK